MNPTLSAIELDIDGMRVHAIRHCDAKADNPPRMLCVHGWLDNANSFLPLMPYMPAFDMVAIDLPGHGYSDPLPVGYNQHELSYFLARVMGALQWPDCHLTGHSLGGGLAPLLAVANPAAVQSLIMIEACGPLSEPANKLPERMARAFNDRQTPQRFKSRVFVDKQAAIDSRLKAAVMYQASARLIIERQLQQHDNGYTWRFDKQWRFASPQYMTEEQVYAVLKAIECPTLAVLADDGFLSNRDNTEERLSCVQNLKCVTLTGNHHLHMDTPEPVAAAINAFLQTTPALGG